jgi:hypothetical protein
MEVLLNDLSTVSRVYDSRGDAVTITINMISIVSQIPVAGGDGRTIADLNVASSAVNSVQAIRSIVNREITAFQESLASVAEWRIETARAVCGRHQEFFSNPFRLQGLNRVVVSLVVDKIDETVSVRISVNQSGLKSLKLSVNVGSHSRIFETGNINGERLTLEKRKFCKVYPEIDNISDSLVVVVRVIDLHLLSGNSGSSAIQIKTYKGAVADERENSGNPAKPIFVPPINESPVYDQALAQAEKADERFTDLQIHKLT